MLIRVIVVSVTVTLIGSSGSRKIQPGDTFKAVTILTISVALEADQQLLIRGIGRPIGTMAMSSLAGEI